jgi:hypothetical protein
MKNYAVVLYISVSDDVTVGEIINNYVNEQAWDVHWDVNVFDVDKDDLPPRIRLTPTGMEEI